MPGAMGILTLRTLFPGIVHSRPKTVENHHGNRFRMLASRVKRQLRDWLMRLSEMEF